MPDQICNSPCECGWPQRAVENKWFPVVFDEKMGEYHLVLDCGDRGKGQAILRHCPWCGGVLPASKRGTYFTVPSEADIADMRLTMSTVKTVEQMYATLGKPAEIFESPWCNDYVYRDDWESLALRVREHKQNFSYSYGGKFRNDSEKPSSNGA